MRYGPSPEQASDIATASGCRITRTHKLFDGEWSFEVDCPTHDAKVLLLANLAEYDAATPDVQRLAEYVTAGARSAEDQIGRAHAWVKRNVAFSREVREKFSPSMHTVAIGHGDCDDSARLLVAILRALDHDAGIMTLGTPPKHAAAGVDLGSGWQWLEATIDARPGEHPMTAARRLGIHTRGDLSSLGQVEPETKIQVLGVLLSAAIGAGVGAAATWASGGRDYLKGAGAGAVALAALDLIL